MPGDGDDHERDRHLWYQLRSPLHGAARPCGAAMRSLLPAAWRHATAAHASAKRDAPERPARSVEAVHSRRLRALRQSRSVLAR